MKKMVTTPAVDIALRTMDADDGRRVRGWLDRLRDWDSDEYVRSHSHILEGVDRTYVLKTGSDMRIFFRMDRDTITILDVAKKAAILMWGQIPESD